jgi:hypothetical protein
MGDQGGRRMNPSIGSLYLKRNDKIILMNIKAIADKLNNS